MSKFYEQHSLAINYKRTMWKSHEYRHEIQGHQIVPIRYVFECNSLIWKLEMLHDLDKEVYTLDK